MTVHYDEDDHVAIITIDRPERRNAMDAEAYAQLATNWRRARDSPTVRVAVITGVDTSFCAGADLESLIPHSVKRARGERSAAADEIVQNGRDSVLRQFDIGKPIVAAVNGHCVASGTEMLLGTDIRIAAENAFFGLTEVARGLFASGGSTVRLPRQIPWVHAMDILLTGRRVSAQEALTMGLINRVVPEGDALGEALEFARLIASNSPTAVAATKTSALRGLGLPLGEAFELEAQIGQHVFAGPDSIEGSRAFLEKRSPEWGQLVPV